jgi:hypothetical protein
MKNNNEFPEWIVNTFNQNQDQLSPRSKEFFEKILENFPHFDQSFLSIPSTTAIGVLKSYDPAQVANQYGFKSSIEFILLNIFESFHFQTIYQLRELGASFFAALSEGRFYVSALLIRSMLEVVSVNYYTLIKVENKLRQNLAYLKSATKTKSVSEKEKLLQIYYQGTYEIFSRLFDANTATSIDWQKNLQDKFGFTVSKSEKRKIIHVHDGIKDLAKASGLPLWEAYSNLSEFVHPNVGSKMLIVNTKHEHDPYMDAITLGENNSNSEAALFFIDYMAESIFYTLTLALTLSDRGQKIIVLLDNMVKEEGSKTVH